MGWRSDIRHGLRQLWRAPSFTLPALIGLALSLGATTAVFSIVHSMLLRPMGLVDPERLVAIWQTDTKRSHKHVEASFADLEEWRKQKQIFEDVAVASSVNLDFPLLGDGEPQQVDGTTVSGAFFHVLGATPAAGRLLTGEDDRKGAPLRLVISHRLWRTRYGADPSIAGRQIRAGGETATIVGVASPAFDFPRDVDLWVALRAAWPEVEQQSRLGVFRTVARLKPGVTREQAEARLNVVAEQIARTLPPGEPSYGAQVTPMLDEIFGPARHAVWVLLAAVFLVLLIACANAANLLLARATVRGRELAVRTVLGAGRGRLLRLLLAEALLLALAAGVLGTAVAYGGVRALARLAPPEVPRMDAIELNAPVLAFGIGLTFATVLLFGLGPAWIASRRDPNDALKQSGRSASAGPAQTRLRGLLIASEVALSVVLLVGAGLLVRSFQKLASIDPGFRPERVLTFRITTATGDQQVRRNLYTQILERVRSLPGVESAGAVLIRPLSGLVGWDSAYAVRGQSVESVAANPNANYEAISPGYFATMGIRLLEGRDFSASDTHTSQGVIIVNEGTARRHWPAHSAVGGQIRIGHDPKAPWLTVVGVVNDVRYREWESARPDLYIPYMQRAQHRSDFVVKTAGDPAALVPAVKREVFAVDRNQPISSVTTMEELAGRAVSRARFISLVLAVLAACAVALAAIGIYGVLSYTVAQRRGEIGVRVAVGATPGRVVRLVLGAGLGLTGAGVIAGLALALALSRVADALLFGVTRHDPFVYSAAAVGLLAVASAACLIPALRAAAASPVRALQSE